MPYLDLTIQYKALESELKPAVERVMAEGKYILGPEVEECERALAQFVGAPYALTAASGTDALLMALLARDIGPGDEVITTAFSFFATAEVIALIGAKPVLVDVCKESFNLDIEQLESKVTSKTKAIMPVSIFGQVADMDEINKVAEKHGLFVIEDAAQSFGATYKGKKSCGLSAMGATSFFPAKPLGCYGDGGAIFCQSEEDFQALQEVRNHGQPSRYYHTRLGINGRLDTMQCAILLAKLKRYPWEIEQRQRIAKVYDQSLQGFKGLMTPKIKSDRDSVYAQYSLLVENRDDFQKKLMELGVPTSIHYPKGMHEQPALKKWMSGEAFPVTEEIGEKVISLPLYADMPAAHVEHVVNSVKRVLG
ncbi:MAG: DegT/DnrJ/EryC1/StrS family aminotransferase [Bdellovibrionales bacterium]|nr:DegT/DnrJ/EryC1/StrS family aminotransferase [Bdellovibrionales bacterium]